MLELVGIFIKTISENGIKLMLTYCFIWRIKTIIKAMLALTAISVKTKTLSGEYIIKAMIEVFAGKIMTLI